MRCFPRYILFFLIPLIFCGCSSQSIIYTDEYIYGQDQQYTIFNSLPGCPMVESEDGYYFMSGNVCLFLYYRDKATGATAPVCNKPECMHNDESCNAYLGRVTALNYYSGKLFYVIDSAFNKTGSKQTALCEVNLDGGGHKELLTFHQSVYQFCIHRGYLYYATTDYGTISGKEDSTQTTMQFYRLPMDKLESKSEFLHEFSGIYANIGRLMCYGNYLYYPHYYYTDETMEKVSSQIDRYNIQDGTITTICENSTTYINFFNDKLAITYPDGTYLCDLDGQNMRKVWNRGGILLPSSKYLLVDTISNINLSAKYPRIIAIIDAGGYVVGSTKLDEKYFYPVGVVDNSYLVFMDDSDTGNQIIYQIPLDQIAEGKAVPKEFFKYVSEG